MLSVKKRSNRLLFLLPTAVILLIITFVVIILSPSKTSAPTRNSVIEVIKIEPYPISVSSNVLFLGNVYWGRYINDWSMASSLKYEYPFSRLNEFKRDQYDAWIAGLECPVVDGINMTSAEEDNTLTFNCSPNYLPQATKWFTAFTLANNHTDNQGIDGFAETKQQLDKNNIQYFGHYDPRVIDDVCEIISLPVTVVNDDKSITKGKLPIAMCGYHGVFRIPTQESVDEMQKYSKYMTVVAMPHMGAEYKTSPDQLKIDFYRSLIDGGADMVMGDHPHWIQNTESYKGHLIAYSLGNFIFDQQDTSEVVRSAGIRTVMEINNNQPDLLKKWLAIGETCATFKDECLVKITEQNLSKLDVVYKFDVIGTNDSGKIAKPATVDQQNSILNRLNWQSTINKLQVPYSSL